MGKGGKVVSLGDRNDAELSLLLSQSFEAILSYLTEVYGSESLGVAVLLHPISRTPETREVREFQYISNMPREHVKEGLRGLLTRWDSKETHTAPHEKL